MITKPFRRVRNKGGGIPLRTRDIRPGCGRRQAIERHAASVFCNSHDVLHRHRAPFETTRAKEPQPRCAALSAGCLSLTIRFRHRLRLLTCLTRHT
jgi:hypothetical protein